MRLHRFILAFGFILALTLLLIANTQAAKQQQQAVEQAASKSKSAKSKQVTSKAKKQTPTTTAQPPEGADDDDDEDDDDDDDNQEENEVNSNGARPAGGKKQDKRVAEWIKQSKQQKGDFIELVESEMLELLVDNMQNLVVLFYDPVQCQAGGSKSAKCKKILQELENIDDDTDEHGIQFVKCEDVQYAKSIGISQLPSLVYFEQHSSAPSIYVGDLEEEEAVLQWLLKQKNEDTIENINRDILNNLITKQKDSSNKRTGQKERQYLAVLFYRHNNDKSDSVLEQLESIDDDLSEYDIHLVKLADDLIAKKYGVRNPPGLVLFRHGEPLKFDGDLMDTNDLLNWLTKPGNLETKDSIESVNEKMFFRFLKETEHLAVLFHSESSTTCKQCPRVMEELENIDDDLADLGVRFIKVDNMNLARRYGVHALPALVYISKEITDSSRKSSGSKEQITIYAGDLKKGEEILRWISELKSPHLNEIPELTGKQVKDLAKQREHLAVFVYDQDDPPSSGGPDGSSSNNDDEQDDGDKDDGDNDMEILAGLENIDSECRKHAIEFVKTSDQHFAAEFGLLEDEDDLPALLYFEHGQVSIYDGDLEAEEDLLDWLLKQKREDTIEEVNRKMLEKLIENSHYLVVLFQKSHCKSCQAALETLEKIDDDCDAYGINMVKITDMALAKRYGIKTFPAIVYFRNGNPLIYSGDLKDDQEVLEWLLDDEQRELNDEIEDINGRMLDKLIDSSPFLAVLFYDDDCGSLCSKVLHELEKIDDDTDLYGIDFVKINDFQAARRYNVHQFPTLVYFRKQSPSYYDGDLLDEENVLSWLTSSDVFELEDEIEEVNKKMLDKLLETSDYIAVYFYEKNCKKCEEVIKELEHIDDEADSLDIMFVKIRDMQYAKKFGITQAPSLVYFRKKFPSIYRGDLMKEEKVLEWLRKNRYRNPELNLFMYALFAITISFILYTLFLLFCVKKKQD